MTSKIGSLSLKTVSTHSLIMTCLSSRLKQITSLSSQPTSIFIPIILSLCLDFFLGWLVFWSTMPHPSLTDSIYLGMDRFVRELKNLITWMMENPAGLKLNSVLSQALGNFFLYHIHLWVTYVMLVIPFLTPHLTTIVSIARYTTLTIQISFLGDLFMLLTIHVHCFYAYARRLALSQYKGIVALWRLFIGKKYNPLRDRVDSADCTVEQLFLGTIIFTILLFLFPTTLTFFSVFFTLKCIAKLITHILKFIILLFHWLPAKES